MTTLDAARAAAGRRRATGILRARSARVRRASATEVSDATRVLTWSLAVLAGLALWLVVFAVGLSALQEQHQQHSLYASFRQQLAAATAPIGGALREGAPVAMLDAPGAHLDDLIVVEGTSSTDLRSGPGHFPGDPLPGQAGVSLIMGRSVSYGGPFAHLAALHTGDTITATTGQGVFHYVVEDVRRAGDPYPAALAAGAGQLTLASSEGSGWLGWAPNHTVFVDAALQGKADPAPAASTISTAADGVMGSDTSRMYPMILWLQLLAATVVAIVWSRSRWGGRPTWLVGTPVLLAALWGATSSFWPLLPNLF